MSSKAHRIHSKLVHEPNNNALLEKYWEEHRVSEQNATTPPAPEDSPTGYYRFRAASTTSLAIPNRSLMPHHPALALPELLRTFGPLLFPLFRAALRQSRILILGEAPVELTCDFVYNISVLASLSRSLVSVVPVDDPAKLRLQPLFNVGIIDIDLLSSLKSPWIACTTDDVLCSKPQLFDLLVIMPAAAARERGANKTFPKLIPSSPELARAYPRQGVRATQRDARRYQTLKTGLKALPDSQRLTTKSSPTPNDAEDDSLSTQSTVSTIPDKHEAVESVSWPLIAYTSLVWWASAGDRRSGLMEAEEQENEQDAALLQQGVDGTEMTKEVALVAYFHRLSAVIFQGLAKAVQRSTKPEQYHDGEPDDDDDDPATEVGDDQDALLDRSQDDEESVEIEEEDVRSIGLDIWSESDRQFLVDMLHLWWGRTAVVRGGTIECCGLRIA